MRRCSFFLLFFYSWVAAAASVNRTIDDTYGDSVTGAKPSYLPTSSSVWQGPSCTGCYIQPDPDEAFDRTWTAATYNPGLGSMSIEFSFTGTAIYVFFILANYVAEGITTETACDFVLDGTTVSSMDHTPSTSTALEYNSLVFSQTNLANAAHTLEIVTSGYNRDIFVNFDYAIYTLNSDLWEQIRRNYHYHFLHHSFTLNLVFHSIFHDFLFLSHHLFSNLVSVIIFHNVIVLFWFNLYCIVLFRLEVIFPIRSSTSSAPSATQTEASKSKPIGAIVGGILGGVAAILIICLLFLFCRRRRNDLSEEQYPVMEAFRNQSTSNSAAGWQARNTHATFLQSGLVSPSNASDAPIVLAPQRYGNHNSNASISERPSNSDLYVPSILTAIKTRLDYVCNDSAASSSAYSPPASETSSSLPHVPRADILPVPMDTKGRARAREKMDRQMPHMAHEMSNLNPQAAVPVGGRQDASEIEQMREQMRVMRDRIEILTHQQQSEALVMTDEPPPDYSSAHR
ncbi:hypothetical protein H0H92_002990 [Tricholoma furcatifolium]|nr:hypothetical protein H0H92_002990 [Tricholoma furcatifolium]